jgi:iron complex outermembrane receptor protein
LYLNPSNPLLGLLSGSANGNPALASLLNGTTPLTGAGPNQFDVKSSAPTWTLGIDYKLPATLLYGKVSRGYKAGGISPQAVTPSEYTFKPEYVKNFEIGQKSDFTIGGRLPVRVNTAVYYTDYTNIQRTATDIYGVEFGAATVNAASASVEGVENELTIQPLERLTLLLNYAYTEAKYKQFSMVLNAITPQLDCSGNAKVNGDTINLSCVPFAFVPKHQASMTARYQLPAPESAGRMDASVTYSYTDRMYSSFATVPEGEPGAWIGAYALLGASVDWTNIGGTRFDLRAYGTNLTNKVYRVSNTNVWSFLYFQSSIYGAPRMLGLQAAYHWGP